MIPETVDEASAGGLLQPRLVHPLPNYQPTTTMPKYSLSAQITVSAFCEVEADSLEEAIEKSQSMGAVIHSYNTGTSPKESWCVEEIDGEPVEISAEEILG